MPRLALAAVLALSFAPAAAAPRKPVDRKPADPLQAWFEADDLVAQGESAKALAALNGALESIRKMPDSAEVKGPGGAAWPRKEAEFRYTLRAAEVASLASWRDAAALLESALKLAPDRAARQEAEIQLEAARAQLAAGNDRAPSFLGDDRERMVEEPGAVKVE